MFRHYKIKLKNFTGNFSSYFCIESDEKIITFYTFEYMTHLKGTLKNENIEIN